MDACIPAWNSLKRSFRKRQENKLLKLFQNVQLLDEAGDIHQRFCPGPEECFEPPIPVQQFNAVRQILQRRPWRRRIKKLVEFGSGDSIFLKIYLKSLKIRDIVQVDIDGPLVNERWVETYPGTIDLYRPRRKHQRVTFFAGTACQPDPRFLEADAVVAIELLQHLYPDALEALVYNVFAYIKPFMVIFTTANSDFKECLPQEYIDDIFHNEDVKHIWNAEEFESWATNICDRYPNYMVRFHGIGPSPVGFDPIRYHTQTAVFLKYQDKALEDSNGGLGVYEIQSHGICTYNKRVAIYKPLQTVGTTLEFCYFTPMQFVPDLVPFTLPTMELSKECLFFKRFHTPLKANIRAQFVVQLICPDEEIFCKTYEIRSLLELCGFHLRYPFVYTPIHYSRGAFIISKPDSAVSLSSGGTIMSIEERNAIMLLRRWRRSGAKMRFRKDTATPLEKLFGWLPREDPRSVWQEAFSRQELQSFITVNTDNILKFRGRLRIEIPSRIIPHIPSPFRGHRFQYLLDRSLGSEEDTGEESDVESLDLDIAPVRMAEPNEYMKYDVSWLAIIMEREFDEAYMTDFTPIEQRKTVLNYVANIDSSTYWVERFAEIYEEEVAAGDKSVIITEVEESTYYKELRKMEQLKKEREEQIARGAIRRPPRIQQQIEIKYEGEEESSWQSHPQALRERQVRIPARGADIQGESGIDGTAIQRQTQVDVHVARKFLRPSMENLELIEIKDEQSTTMEEQKDHTRLEMVHDSETQEQKESLLPQIRERHEAIFRLISTWPPSRRLARDFDAEESLEEPDTQRMRYMLQQEEQRDSEEEVTDDTPKELMKTHEQYEKVEEEQIPPQVTKPLEQVNLQQQLQEDEEKRARMMEEGQSLMELLDQQQKSEETPGISSLIRTPVRLERRSSRSSNVWRPLPQWEENTAEKALTRRIKKTEALQAYDVAMQSKKSEQRIIQKPDTNRLRHVLRRQGLKDSVIKRQKKIERAAARQAIKEAIEIELQQQEKDEVEQIPDIVSVKQSEVEQEAIRTILKRSPETSEQRQKHGEYQIAVADKLKRVRFNVADTLLEGHEWNAIKWGVPRRGEFDETDSLRIRQERKEALEAREALLRETEYGFRKIEKPDTQQWRHVLRREALCLKKSIINKQKQIEEKVAYNIKTKRLIETEEQQKKDRVKQLAKTEKQKEPTRLKMVEDSKTKEERGRGEEHITREIMKQTTEVDETIKQQAEIQKRKDKKELMTTTFAVVEDSRTKEQKVEQVAHRTIKLSVPIQQQTEHRTEEDVREIKEQEIEEEEEIELVRTQETGHGIVDSTTKREKSSEAELQQKLEQDEAEEGAVRMQMQEIQRLVEIMDQKPKGTTDSVIKSLQVDVQQKKEKEEEYVGRGQEQGAFARLEMLPELIGFSTEESVMRSQRPHFPWMQTEWEEEDRVVREQMSQIQQLVEIMDKNQREKGAAASAVEMQEIQRSVEIMDQKPKETTDSTTKALQAEVQQEKKEKDEHIGRGQQGAFAMLKMLPEVIGFSTEDSAMISQPPRFPQMQAEWSQEKEDRVVSGQMSEMQLLVEIMEKYQKEKEEAAHVAKALPVEVQKEPEQSKKESEKEELECKYVVQPRKPGLIAEDTVQEEQQPIGSAIKSLQVDVEQKKEKEEEHIGRRQEQRAFAMLETLPELIEFSTEESIMRSQRPPFPWMQTEWEEEDRVVREQMSQIQQLVEIMDKNQKEKGAAASAVETEEIQRSVEIMDQKPKETTESTTKALQAEVQQKKKETDEHIGGQQGALAMLEMWPEVIGFSTEGSVMRSQPPRRPRMQTEWSQGKEERVVSGQMTQMQLLVDVIEKYQREKEEAANIAKALQAEQQPIGSAIKSQVDVQRKKGIEDEHIGRRQEQGAFAMLGMLPELIELSTEDSVMRSQRPRFPWMQTEWSQEEEDRVVKEQMSQIQQLVEIMDKNQKEEGADASAVKPLPVEIQRESEQSQKGGGKEGLECKYVVQPRKSDLIVEDTVKTKQKPIEGIIEHPREMQQQKMEEEEITIIEKEEMRGTQLIIRREVGINVEDAVTKQDKEMEALAARRAQQRLEQYKKEHEQDEAEQLRRKQKDSVMKLIKMARRKFADDDPAQKWKTAQIDYLLKKMHEKDIEKARTTAKPEREESCEEEPSSERIIMQDAEIQTDEQWQVKQRLYFLQDNTDKRAARVATIKRHRKEISALQVLYNKLVQAELQKQLDDEVEERMVRMQMEEIDRLVEDMDKKPKEKDTTDIVVKPPQISPKKEQKKKIEFQITSKDVLSYLLKEDKNETHKQKEDIALGVVEDSKTKEQQEREEQIAHGAIRRTPMVVQEVRRQKKEEDQIERRREQVALKKEQEKKVEFQIGSMDDLSYLPKEDKKETHKQTKDTVLEVAEDSKTKEQQEREEQIAYGAIKRPPMVVQEARRKMEKEDHIERSRELDLQKQLKADEAEKRMVRMQMQGIQRLVKIMDQEPKEKEITGTVVKTQVAPSKEQQKKIEFQIGSMHDLSYLLKEDKKETYTQKEDTVLEVPEDSKTKEREREEQIARGAIKRTPMVVQARTKKKKEDWIERRREQELQKQLKEDEAEKRMARMRMQGIPRLVEIMEEEPKEIETTGTAVKTQVAPEKEQEKKVEFQIGSMDVLSYLQKEDKKETHKQKEDTVLEVAEDSKTKEQQEREQQIAHGAIKRTPMVVQEAHRKNEKEDQVERRREQELQEQLEEEEWMRMQMIEIHELVNILAQKSKERETAGQQLQKQSQDELMEEIQMIKMRLVEIQRLIKTRQQEAIRRQL